MGIETLEDLEAAAHDGRLEQVLGFGPTRLAGIRDSLAHRLQRVRPPEAGRNSAPSVEDILDVDREYREKAAAGQVVTIAPRRFNPSRVAWLPILHTTRGRRHYTALFSNTALAHRLARTDDWVVILLGRQPRRAARHGGHGGPRPVEGWAHCSRARSGERTRACGECRRRRQLLSVTTGQDACLPIWFVDDPKTVRSSALRPCTPMTIRST